jgi:hypothetical protein
MPRRPYGRCGAVLYRCTPKNQPFSFGLIEKTAAAIFVVAVFFI